MLNPQELPENPSSITNQNPTKPTTHPLKGRSSADNKYTKTKKTQQQKQKEMAFLLESRNLDL